MEKKEEKKPQDGTPTRTDPLTRKMGRFGLAMAVAKRASSLIEIYRGRSNGRHGTVERALSDIASGRARIVREESPAQSAADVQRAEKGRSRRKKAA